MNYSLNKIANELNLSKTTVSLVLNGKSESARISKDVEKRVKDFCEKVHYSPNIHAQRMNKKTVKNVGFLVDKNLIVDNANPLSDSIISEIIGGVVIAAEKVGYRVTLDLFYHQMDEKKVFEWFRTKEIDGLIYYGLSLPEHWIKTFTDEGRKVVGIDIEPCNGLSTVSIDNTSASKKLTLQVIESGKKNFLYLDGVKHSYTGRSRRQGFEEALKECGLEISADRIIQCEFSENIAYKKVSEVFSSGVEVDAIIAGNDMMAFGAMRVAKELGIIDKIAITGMDNVPLCNYVSPTLTSVVNKNYERGEAAFNLLVDMIKNKKKTENIVLDTEIIRRESF